MNYFNKLKKTYSRLFNRRERENQITNSRNTYGIQGILTGRQTEYRSPDIEKVHK